MLCRSDDANYRGFVMRWNNPSSSDDDDGGGGYATHFVRPSSDYFSRQISDVYTRQFSPDSDEAVTPITRFQLRPGNFGGIAQRRRKEFGRGLSTLLTDLTTNTTGDVENGHGQGRAVGSSSNIYARHLSLRSDDEDGQSRGVDSNNDGYARQLSGHNDDNDKASGDFRLRPGRFGGISGRYQNVYGRGPRTFLTGRHGFLTSSIDTDDIETNQRGRGVGSGDAAASQRSGSVLARLGDWRRSRFSRQQTPRNEMEMQVPEWLREKEPEERRRVSFVDNDDSDSHENYARQLPPSSLDEEQDVRADNGFSRNCLMRYD